MNYLLLYLYCHSILCTLDTCEIKAHSLPEQTRTFDRFISSRWYTPKWCCCMSLSLSSKPPKARTCKWVENSWQQYTIFVQTFNYVDDRSGLCYVFYDLLFIKLCRKWRQVSPLQRGIWQDSKPDFSAFLGWDWWCMVWFQLENYGQEQALLCFNDYSFVCWMCEWRW